MEVRVATADRLFFSAVEAVAGAMGHRAREAAGLEGGNAPGLLIVDLGTIPFSMAEVARLADALRTVVFVPAGRADLMAAAQASGILHAYARTALATELPRVLAQYTDGGV